MQAPYLLSIAIKYISNYGVRYGTITSLIATDIEARKVLSEIIVSTIIP